MFCKKGSFLTRTGLLSVCLAIAALAATIGAAPTLPYVEFPGPTPGAAVGTVSGTTLTLENNVIKMTWSTANSHLVPTLLLDKVSNKSITLTGANAFNIKVGTAATVLGSTYTITTTAPQAVKVNAVSATHIKLANRIGGMAISLTLRSPANDLEVTWKAILLDGTNYIRQEYTFKNMLASAQNITYYYLFDQPGTSPKQVGTTAGSPVTDSTFFFGIESPFAFNSVANKKISSWIKKTSTLAANGTYRNATVIGVAPPGQMRRSFLYYLSLQRPHYYRHFRMYNSWYDIPNNFTDPSLAAVINALGPELCTKRGMALNSFVADDGWDNPNSARTWWFNSNLPKGFQNAMPIARPFNAGFGVWMATFGGYSGCQQRIDAGKAYGAETKYDAQAGQTWLSMAGPNYYHQYKQSLLDLIAGHGVNTVKVEMGAFDEYRELWQDDQEATMHLSDTLRLVDSNFYFNFWSATWASPFWLMSAESIVKGAGGDNPNLTGDMFGTNKREWWIGGRDWRTYTNIAALGPLYPMSSLAIHGICIAKRLYPADYGLDIPNIKHEVRSYCASGLACQELYVSPTILTQEMYDIIAEGSKWSDANVDIQEDTHWIGGNPSTGAVYGRAAWNKRGGILYLRNPTITAKSYTFDIKNVFELPEGAPTKYTLKSPWADEANMATITVTAGTPYTINLAAQQVLVYDATPVGSEVTLPSGHTFQAKLARVSANPFRSSVTVDFHAKGNQAKASVLSLSGTTIRTLNAEKVSGGCRVVWDGKDSGRNPAPAGVYFIQFRSGNSTITTKVQKVL